MYSFGGFFPIRRGFFYSVRPRIGVSFGLSLGIMGSVASFALGGPRPRKRKRQLTSVFLPRKPMAGGAWSATVQSQKESHKTEQLSNNDDLGSRRKHGTFIKKETGKIFIS